MAMLDYQRVYYTLINSRSMVESNAHWDRLADGSWTPSCVLATSTSCVGINWISMRLQTTIQIYILFRYFSLNGKISETYLLFTFFSRYVWYFTFFFLLFFFLHGQITIDWLPPVRWISPILLLGLESPWRWKQVDKNEQNNNIFQLQVA